MLSKPIAGLAPCPHHITQGLNMSDVIHFVGFRGEEYWSAVKVWGKPDFYHRSHDNRAIAEFMEGDTVVFADHYEDKFTQYTFDDSNVF